MARREYAKNDAEGGRGEFKDLPLRRTFERLLRKLMQYPHRPAVLMIQAFPWVRGREGGGHPPLTPTLQSPSLPPPLRPCTLYPPQEDFHSMAWSVERELNEFSAYYRIPTASVKAAAYHHMLAGVNIKMCGSVQYGNCCGKNSLGISQSKGAKR